MGGNERLKKERLLEVTGNATNLFYAWLELTDASFKAFYNQFAVYKISLLLEKYQCTFTFSCKIIQLVGSICQSQKLVDNGTLISVQYSKQKDIYFLLPHGFHWNFFNYSAWKPILVSTFRNNYYYWINAKWRFKNVPWVCVTVIRNYRVTQKDAYPYFVR